MFLSFAGAWMSSREAGLTRKVKFNFMHCDNAFWYLSNVLPRDAIYRRVKIKYLVITKNYMCFAVAGRWMECLRGIKISPRDLALAGPRSFFWEFEELGSIYSFPNSYLRAYYVWGTDGRYSNEQSKLVPSSNRANMQVYFNSEP